MKSTSNNIALDNLHRQLNKSQVKKVTVDAQSFTTNNVIDDL